MSINCFHLPQSNDACTIWNMNVSQLEKTQERLKNKNFTVWTSISDDEDLGELCQKDLSTLSSKDISCDQISQTLRALIRPINQMAKRSAEEIIELGMGEKFHVTCVKKPLHSDQSCPFCYKTAVIPCKEEGFEYTITNLYNQMSLTFSEFSLRLIERHAFFGSHFFERLDPESICMVTEIKKKYPIRIEQVWKLCRFDDITKEALEAAKKNATLTQTIAGCAKAYLGLTYMDHKKRESTLDSDARYCHLFALDPLLQEEGEPIIIDGRAVEIPINGRGIYVFEPKDISYADLPDAFFS